MKRKFPGFDSVQFRVVLGCILAYTAAYFNRLNLSAMLGGMEAAFGIGDAQAGTFQTAFALTYAAGQLVNGTLVDRVRPGRYMAVGLAGSAVINLLMGASTGYGMTLALCIANGVFQSMLWTPIVRLVAANFAEGPSRKRANLLVSLTLVMGHLGAWSIVASVTSVLEWRFGFWVPGILGLLAAGGVFFLLRGVSEGHTDPGKAASQETASAASLGLLMKTGLPFVLLSCVFYGFSRDGIVTWAPKTITALSENGSMTATLLIPLINILGILGGYALNRRGFKNVRLCTGFMMGGAALVMIPLLMVENAWLTALCMGISCAFLYGLNPLLTSLLPMEYDKLKRVGLTAGLIDSFIYLGSAMTGVVGGLISEGSGMSSLYVGWLLAAVAGMIFVMLSGMKVWTKYMKAKDELQ